ncbi:TPA: hypothetical protein ACLEZY_001087 [Pseudomonas aeruginosa]
MSIDWSCAPAEATHYCIGDDLNPWRKIVGTTVYALNRKKWVMWSSFNEGYMPAYYAPIPLETWDGQGLPPVGTVCEYNNLEPHPVNTDLKWSPVHIVAHDTQGGEVFAVFSSLSGYHGDRRPGCFRPIRTPEQIAAEEREKAIEEMCFAEETLTVKQAKALYDAGYRRQDEAIKRNADRYLWLRNPDQDVSLVLDKVSGEVPADEFGCGGYRTYEYRSGDELDAAIDAAMESMP